MTANTTKQKPYCICDSAGSCHYAYWYTLDIWPSGYPNGCDYHPGVWGSNPTWACHTHILVVINPKLDNTNDLTGVSPRWHHAVQQVKSTRRTTYSGSLHLPSSYCYYLLLCWFAVLACLLARARLTRKWSLPIVACLITFQSLLLTASSQRHLCFPRFVVLINAICRTNSSTRHDCICLYTDMVGSKAGSDIN